MRNSVYYSHMKKGLFIGFTAFLALFGASFAHADAKIDTKAAAIDQKDTTKEAVKDEIVLTGDAKIAQNTIDKLADLADRAKITLDRFTAKGYDTTDAAKLLQNADNTLTIARSGLVAKDQKNQISIKKAQELIKTAKQSLVDSLNTLKALTEKSSN